jgi:5-methyltetrahydrofolate--homocysteine methyltransferase
MSKELITFNKKEALRYFRAQSNDKSAEMLIGAAYQKLKSELQPRYTVKRFACSIESEGDDAVPSLVVLDNGTVFRSKALARYVGEAKELFLFGATLGSRVDSALRRMALTSVAEAGAGQAVAAALVETYCDDCCAELQKQLPEGKKLKWRFSPGYGDWSLEEQRILFPVLDCAHTIGLTLTESCMMAPVKSVTALMAITDATAKDESERIDNEENLLEEFNCNRKVTERHNLFSNPGNKCLRCGKTDCEFRQK